MKEARVSVCNKALTLSVKIM